MELEEFCFNADPCRDAKEWLKNQKSIKQAWEDCWSGTWMLWAIHHSIKAKELSEEEWNKLIEMTRKDFQDSGFTYIEKERHIAAYLRGHILYPWRNNK